MQKPLPVIVGIDGGATYSFGVAVDRTGQVLATVQAGTLNFFGSSLQEARRNLTALIKGLEIQLPLGNKFDQVVMGTAALFAEATADQKERLCSGIAPLDRTRLVSDCMTAYHGASLGQPAVLAICGTGSIVLAQNEHGRFFQTGGWGHLLGDEGSAYWIAIKCLQAAIAAIEGRGPQTGMVESIMAWFEIKELSEIVPVIYNPKYSKDKLAALSQHLASTLGEDDAVFRDICVQGGRELAAQITAAIRLVELYLDPIPLYLVGGVLTRNLIMRKSLIETLEKEHSIRIEQPQLPPLLGAAVLALAQSGVTPTPEIVARLRDSYQQALARKGR